MLQKNLSTEWRVCVVIDPEETKRSLFGGLKGSSAPKAGKTASSEDRKSKTSDLPKWKTLEKVTVLLTNQQRDAIEDVARSIMRFRSQEEMMKEERERITANTVVRALIDNFIEKIPNLKMKAITNEEEVKEWVKQLFE